jgi:hypothetical protein
MAGVYACPWPMSLWSGPLPHVQGHSACIYTRMTSLSYELAKELKDAGFECVQHTSHREGSLCGRPEAVHDKCNDWECHLEYLEYPDPTLSELIEAFDFCESFLLKKKDTGYKVQEGEKWCATYSHSGELNDWVHGSSPEEAVARLWLALNKKA